MSQHPILNVIQVASPCQAPWEQMSGDEQRRFCTHCKKFVHNLTAMPADEAEKLICSSAGDLCVRFARDPRSGQVITLDYRSPPRSSRGRAFAVIASILASASIAATWVGYKVMRKPLPPPPPPAVFVAGGMAAPPVRATPTPISQGKPAPQP
jgi:hypothetical protein